MTFRQVAAVYKLMEKMGDPHMADSPYINGHILKRGWLRDMGIDVSHNEAELGLALYEVGRATADLPPEIVKNISDYFLGGSK